MKHFHSGRIALRIEARLISLRSRHCANSTPNHAWSAWLSVLALLVSVATQANNPQPGTRDPSFDPSVGPDRPIRSLLLQADGKIMIGGFFQHIGGVTRVGIARLQPDGSVDGDFDAGPTVSEFGSVNQMQLQEDGKILVTGAFWNGNSGVLRDVGRFNTDGSLDFAITVGHPLGGTDPAFAEPWLSCLVQQADGKIFIGGHFTSVNGVIRYHVARLNVDGTVDETFIPALDNYWLVLCGNLVNQAHYGAVDTVVLQPDGKIVLNGSSLAVNGVGGPAAPSLIRLHPDGSLDESFLPDEPGARVLRCLPDGGLLVVGQWGLTRLNPDGSRDSTFDERSLFPVDPSLIIDAQGRILVASDSSISRFISRLSSDGIVDEGFNFVPGAGPTGPVSAMAMQTDGRILVAGDFGIMRLFGGEATPVAPQIHEQPRSAHALEWATARFGAEAYGYPKPTCQWRFNGADILGATNFQFEIPSVHPANAGSYTVLAINGAGEVLSESAILTVTPRPLRIEPPTVDSSFNPDAGPSFGWYVAGLAVQADGKVILSTWSPFNPPQLVRLHSDGRLDSTFAGAVGSIYSLALQDDQRILFSGDFVSVQNAPRPGLARLERDGKVDPTFTPAVENHGSTPVIGSIGWQPDGRILIAGNLTAVSGVARRGLARLNSDGSLDGSFDPGTNGPLGSLDSVLPQLDGQVLVAGQFARFNNVPRRSLARLRNDGSLDPTFDPAVDLGGPTPQITLGAVQPDGKILITGNFTNIQGLPRNRLARLLPNGQVDDGFDAGSIRPLPPGSPFPPSPLSLALQPDGRIIVAGQFRDIQGSARVGLARLHTDGRVDLSFAAHSFFRYGPDFHPPQAVVWHNDTVVVAGDFALVDGSEMEGVARFYGQPSSRASLLGGRESGRFALQLSVNPGRAVIIEVTTNLLAPEWVPIVPEAGPGQLWDPQPPNAPQRFYRVRLP